MYTKKKRKRKKKKKNGKNKTNINVKGALGIHPTNAALMGHIAYRLMIRFFLLFVLRH
jgi:hypothetical protein